ncbi:MAG: hypothetical protein ACE5R6_20335 [Candidatus Heimdallarchaeota archaeon]
MEQSVSGLVLRHVGGDPSNGDFGFDELLMRPVAKQCLIPHNRHSVASTWRDLTGSVPRQSSRLYSGHVPFSYTAFHPKKAFK